MRRRSFEHGGCALGCDAITAAFLRAMMNGAFLLGSLFKEKWRVAVRARLGDGLVPEHHVTFWIFRAAVESFAALRFLDDNLAATTRARARHTGRLALDITALGIV